MEQQSGNSIALIVLDHTGAILTLKRPQKFWDLPNMDVVAGDSIRRACSDLLHQETNLCVFPVQWNMVSVSRQNGLLYVMWVKFTHRPLAILDERYSIDFKWVQPHRMLQPIAPYVRDVIDKVSGQYWNLAPIDPDS